jgi:hypothetical protein
MSLLSIQGKVLNEVPHTILSQQGRDSVHDLSDRIDPHSDHLVAASLRNEVIGDSFDDRE